MISAIVLAAGESKRMGELKQLLPLGESTVLEQTIKNLLDSKVDEVILVLGYQAKGITQKIADKPIKIVMNPDFQQGMSSSIKCGLTKISEGSDAIMIVLGDQPLIGKDIINMLMEMHSNSRFGITVPIYKGIKGHPVIFSAKYKDELLRLTGDSGGKRIIEEHLNDLLEVEVDSESIIIDMNTINDYRNLTRRHL